jgi:cytochrome c oxidase subunit 1
MSAAAPAPMDAAARRGVFLYVATYAIVLSLLALFGLIMRLAQGGLLSLDPSWFYRLMTAHGAGMVGIAGVGSSAVMWYFLRQYAPLSATVLLINLVLFLVGAVLLLGGIFLGGFAGGWTFLFPLPQHSNGGWGAPGAAGFLGGLLLIGTGFLLLFLDVARAVMQRYGSLAKALGWPQAFGTSAEEAPPATVVAATVVALINILALVAGAAVLVMELVALAAPGFAIDALLAKNMTFFFGHVFINSTMYMAVIGVYEILARYTGRPWKSSRPFLLAWSATLLMVLTVYPHHLLMDFAMPTWMLVMGQVISWTSGIPVLAVTAVGALGIVYRSELKWDAVAPAIADGTIVVNQMVHNTLWVPGHFHFYLILGTTAMILGFALFLVRGGAAPAALSAVDRATFWMYTLGTLGFVSMFLWAGRLGVPRRYAIHQAAWMPYDRIASAFGALVVAAMLVLVTRFLGRMRSAIAGP